MTIPVQSQTLDKGVRILLKLSLLSVKSGGRGTGSSKNYELTELTIMV
jgi:hypothetical protein